MTVNVHSKPRHIVSVNMALTGNLKSGPGSPGAVQLAEVHPAVLHAHIVHEQILLLRMAVKKLVLFAGLYLTPVCLLLSVPVGLVPHRRGRQLNLGGCAADAHVASGSHAIEPGLLGDVGVWGH